MLDPLSFSAPTALQPPPVQGSRTSASVVDQLPNPSSTMHAANASTSGVGPTRAALVAHAHPATATSKDHGDTIVPPALPPVPDLRDAAAKFGPNAPSAYSGAIAHAGPTTHTAQATSSGTTPTNGSDAGKPCSWRNSATDFTKGVGEGVWDGASGMVKGVGDAAKGAYHLAISADARSQAADTIARSATATGKFARMAINDPAKAVSQVGHAASSAVHGVSTAYQQAAANGHGAEFIGKIVGQGAVLAATLPVGGAEAEGAAAVGNVGRLAEAAGDLDKVGEAAADTSKVVHTTDVASNAATQTTASTIKFTAHESSRLDATSQALFYGQTFSHGQPPVDLQHVFQGEIGKKGSADVAKGFHHAPADGLHANAQVAEEIMPRNAQGIYRARVEISKPGDEAVYNKRSTMFPDSMSRDEIVGAIQHAYKNATQKSGNSFSGPSGHGFDINGFTSGSGADFHIRTAYPEYKQ